MQRVLRVQWFHTRINFVGVGSHSSQVVARLQKLAPAAFEKDLRFFCVSDDKRLSFTDVKVQHVPNTPDEHEQKMFFVNSFASSNNNALLQHVSCEDEGTNVVSFILGDMGEGIGGVGAASISHHLREQLGHLCVGVSILPITHGGLLSNARVQKRVHHLREHSDGVVVVDTGTLRQEHLLGAHYGQVLSTFTDMLAHNLISLSLPLLRHDDLKRVQFGHWKQLFKRTTSGLGQEARIVCGQSQTTGTERGREALQKSLTDPLFPVDDVSTCTGLLVCVDCASDLTVGEVEQVMQVAQYVPVTATLVEGVAIAPDANGLHVTICVVRDTKVVEEKEEEDDPKNTNTDQSSNPSGIWKKFREWL